MSLEIKILLHKSVRENRKGLLQSFLTWLSQQWAIFGSLEKRSSHVSATASANPAFAKKRCMGIFNHILGINVTMFEGMHAIYAML